MKRLTIAMILAGAVVIAPVGVARAPEAAAKASAHASATVTKGKVKVSVSCGNRGATQSSPTSSTVGCRR